MLGSRNATPNAVHVKIVQSSDKHRFALVLLLQVFCKVCTINLVEQEIATINVVVEVRPVRTEDSIRWFLCEMVDIVTVLGTCCWGAQRKIVTTILAAFCIEIHL